MKLLVLALLGLVTSCVTTPEKEVSEPKPVVPAFYTLREGAKIEHMLPLPDMRKIMVQWTYSDGGKKAQEGFRGWDIDHDGRFEMLEVLDSAGKPYMWAYDFDDDGVIDVVDKNKQVAIEESEQAPGIP